MTNCLPRYTVLQGSSGAQSVAAVPSTCRSPKAHVCCARKCSYDQFAFAGPQASSLRAATCTYEEGTSGVKLKLLVTFFARASSAAAAPRCAVSASVAGSVPVTGEHVAFSSTSMASCSTKLRQTTPNSENGCEAARSHTDIVFVSASAAHACTVGSPAAQVFAAHEVGQRDGHHVAHAWRPLAQHVQRVLQDLTRHLLLQPRDGLLDAVLRAGDRQPWG